MKTMRKLFALLLALTMVFGLAATGFAATGAAINIKNAKIGETYNIYRIADLSYAKDAEENEAFTYTATADWVNFFKSPGYSATPAGEEAAINVLSYVNYNDDTNVITPKTEIDAVVAGAALAKLAAAYLAANPTLATAADPVTVETVDNNKVATGWTGLDLGWYFVTTSTGSICSLDSNHQTVEILEKNLDHKDDKDVKEGTAWGDKDDKNIGDTVEYRIAVTIQPGAENLVVHDKMSAGLTPCANTAVKVYSDADLANEITNTGNAVYTVQNPTEEADNDKCTFEVKFTQAWLDEIKEATTVYVGCTAVLNEDAIVKGDEDTDAGVYNKNESKLTWGNDSDTQWNEVKTETYEITIEKYTGDGADKKLLEGAEFELYDANNNLIKFDSIEVVDGGIPDEGEDFGDGDEAVGPVTYRVCMTANHTGATHFDKITTDATGVFNLEGLDAGTYYLKEIKAPEGYNLLKYPIKIVIDDNGDATFSAGTAEGVFDDANSTHGFATTGNLYGVLNQSGTELPSTGGMGTTLFYVFGSIMMIGAAVILVTKKRVNG